MELKISLKLRHQNYVISQLYYECFLQSMFISSHFLVLNIEQLLLQIELGWILLHIRKENIFVLLIFS